VSWQAVTLGELITSHWSGHSFNSADYTDTGTPVLTKGDIKPRGIIEHGTRFVDPELIEAKSIKLTTHKDLLVSTRDLTTAANFLGLVAKAPNSEAYAVNQGVTVFRVDESKVDRDFIAYWCEGEFFRGYIKCHYAGATQIHIRHSDLMAAPVRLPTMRVQRRIASILSTYDELIENTSQRIAILEEMARRIYEEWFVHFHFPGHEHVRMVESEFGPVPKGWCLVTLGDVCAYINRGLAPKYDDTAQGIVINQKCIRDQRLNLAEARRQSKTVPQEKFVAVGDVLINSTGVGTLGRVAQVLEPLESCTVDTHVSIVRPSKELDHDFFGLALFSKQPNFEAMGVGSTGQTELSRGRIADTALLLPPKALQDQFGLSVRAMRHLSVKLQAVNRNLRTTRDLLLPKLISGELDVSALPEPGAVAA